jgi:hypothetical protein
MSHQTTNFLRALLQGMTGAGLFRRLDYPGAPTEFIDSRSLEEIKASGEFDLTCRRYGYPAQQEGKTIKLGREPATVR